MDRHKEVSGQLTAPITKQKDNQSQSLKYTCSLF